MSKQHFRLGEEVSLVSTTHPELNGDTFVTGVRFGPTTVDLNGVKGEVGDRYSYELGIENPNGARWAQSALRKKLQGGDDFQSLIHKMNNDQVEKV